MEFTEPQQTALRYAFIRIADDFRKYETENIYAYGRKFGLSHAETRDMIGAWRPELCQQTERRRRIVVENYYLSACESKFAKTGLLEEISLIFQECVKYLLRNGSWKKGKDFARRYALDPFYVHLFTPPARVKK